MSADGDPMRELISIFVNERGATAIEYGLIVALIGIAIISGVTLFAANTIDMWNYVATTIRNATP